LPSTTTLAEVTLMSDEKKQLLQQLEPLIEQGNRALIAELLKDQIDKTLNALTPREKRVLQLRFGLKDGRSRTLEEVGQEFSVNRERIRQIEAKALRKLRHPMLSRKLREY